MRNLLKQEEMVTSTLVEDSTNVNINDHKHDQHLEKQSRNDISSFKSGNNLLVREAVAAKGAEDQKRQ